MGTLGLDKYRRDVILAALEAEGRVRMRELADGLGVSQMTIRRDLLELENAGLLVRVHGGAVSSSTGEPRSTRDRWVINHTAKERIAAAVARLIPHGSRVLLDSGTTVAEVARRLRGRDLEVVTASLQAAWFLADDDATHVRLLGGRVRSRTLSAVGTDVEESIEQVQADFGILGASGVSNDAFYSLVPADVGAQRAIMAASAANWLVVDNAKMGLSAGARVARLSELSGIVTDEAVDDSIGSELPRIVVAEAGEELRQ